MAKIDRSALHAEDLWLNRLTFRTLAKAERERLGLSDSDYWGWLSAQLGGRWSDRSLRAGAMDHKYYPSSDCIQALAKHYSVPAERLHCPSPADRKKQKMAKWAIPVVVVPEVPVVDHTAKRNLLVDGTLREIVERLRKIDEDGLKFVANLLNPYWSHLASKK